ncbi:dihydrolipoamide acetyltransferase family protein [Shouchella clausii]|uniref:dihydrolipoamide acetyltransferase family protein n=1 Tax=Shouchella clausii TaxID=79880 RepID=UPI0021478597|nr:dihydrolipoamide acetyltransferase family protein [Shouchella clausii]MCR1286446.1 2-oxo acid dehydrogenase subunit E2 [Shouchella clausii]
MGTIVMPKLGMTMSEGTIVNWCKEVGDLVTKGEAIVEISSEKLTQELEAQEDGILLAKYGEVDAVMKVGEVLAHIGQEGEEVPETAATPSTAPQSSSSETDTASKTPAKQGQKKGEERIFITPLARKLAKEHNVNIEEVEGTGGNGRITKRDILREASNQVPTQAVKQAANGNAQVAHSDDIGAGLSPIRKTIARNMRASLHNTAQLTLHRKANANALLAFRRLLKTESESHQLQLKLSVTVLIARATILALQQVGAMNSRYENGQLKEFENVHLGIATSLDDGLVVPVIRDAHHLSIGQLATKIEEIAANARSGQSNPDELSGSTFTITNLGASGIEYFTPILNPAETGILGVGSLQQELALSEDGQVEPVQKIPFSLTFDHQIVDGVLAAQFLDAIVKYVENPHLLIL